MKQHETYIKKKDLLLLKFCITTLQATCHYLNTKFILDTGDILFVVNKINCKSNKTER